MAEVMFDQGGTRIVLLDRSFGDAGRNMKELRVRFTKNGAMFFHMEQDAEPKNYGLSTAEADAFVETWLAYRTAQKAAQQTEEERKQALIDEAYRLAGQHIKIETDSKESPTWWQVSIPSQDCYFRLAARYPEQLLEQVKEARALLLGREDVQATA